MQVSIHFYYYSIFVLQNASQYSNDIQKEQQEFQRRHREHIIQHQQKLQELQGQITQQYAAATSSIGPQGLPLFLPFLDQLHGLQAGHLSGVGKSSLPNHVCLNC